MNHAVLEVESAQPIAAEDPYSSLFHFTVAQYEQLIEQGFLEEGAPCELLDGIIFHKNRADMGANDMTHGPGHANRVEQLTLLLSGVARQLGVRMRCQLPLQLSHNDAPEPDFALVIQTSSEVMNRHPQGDEVVLVIEVASSSLKQDRNRKLAIYARAGIPEYWIINLTTKQLEIFRTPDSQQGSYQESRVLLSGDQTQLTGGAGQSISLQVADLV